MISRCNHLRPITQIKPHQINFQTLLYHHDKIHDCEQRSKLCTSKVSRIRPSHTGLIIPKLMHKWSEPLRHALLSVDCPAAIPWHWSLRPPRTPLAKRWQRAAAWVGSAWRPPTACGANRQKKSCPIPAVQSRPGPSTPMPNKSKHRAQASVIMLSMLRWPP